MQTAELFLFSVQVLIFQSCQVFFLNHTVPLGMYTDFCQVILLSFLAILGFFASIAPGCTIKIHQLKPPSGVKDFGTVFH